MDNAVENGKKFDLSQNSFVIFMFGYSPIVIIGSIIIFECNRFLPDIMTKIMFGLLIIGSIIKGIMDLQLNKRTLVISDNEISVYLKKRKNNLLLTKINNDEIASIKQLYKEAFVISKKNGQEEIIHLSCSLKPYSITLYSIKKALYNIYGKERTDFAQDNLLIKYINKRTMPKELLDADNFSKMRRILLVILYVVFAGLPTIIGVLALILFILYLIIGFLKGIIAILAPFVTK